jgi:TolB-like protein
MQPTRSVTVREFAAKLRITAAALGCTTQKELCAQFLRVNPGTTFDLIRSYKWMQGRALPRSAKLYDDWALLLGTERSPAYLQSCTLDDFLDLACQRFGLSREALVARAGLDVAPRPEMAEQRNAPKTSIAVLPFANMSGDTEQQYFSDGITEDIITELSRFRQLTVIARHSSPALREKALDVTEIGNWPGVQYLVDGSVRRLGDRVRVTARLVETESGNHVWSEHYDRDLADIFTVQDEVVQSIVARLEGRLAATVAEQARQKPTVRLGAYDCVLQARAHLNDHGAERAEPLLLRAIELDPGYAQAYAWLARTCVIKFFFDSRPTLLDQALENGRMATRLDENDGLCHWALANAHLFRREFEQAAVHFDRALALNPSDVLIFSTYCHWLSRNGRWDEALQGLNQILLRNPFPQGWYWEIRALALVQATRYEEAIQSIRRMPELFVWEYACLAGCYARLGKFDEAYAQAAMTLRVRPDFSIRWLLLQEPFKDPRDAERFVEFLRNGGLPE